MKNIKKLSNKYSQIWYRIRRLIRKVFYVKVIHKKNYIRNETK